MAGKPSAKLIAAIKLLEGAKGELSAYAAAHRAGITVSTLYRSPLYKLWRDGKPDALRVALVQAAKKPR